MQAENRNIFCKPFAFSIFVGVLRLSIKREPRPHDYLRGCPSLSLSAIGRSGWTVRNRPPPAHLLRPYDSEAMQTAPCNPLVGNVRNNGPEMLNSA